MEKAFERVLGKAKKNLLIVNYEKKINQATGNFLMRILEKFSRQNIFVYYWMRRLLPLYVYLTGTPHERFFNVLKNT